MLPNFFSNKYPYTDFHELNLDWIINQLKEMSIQLEKFVSLNTIKYAEPIQWDITRQYETNTIVIDPITGTAYISVQPVPSGVAITNTDYWTVVFSLSEFLTKMAQNLANVVEPETTLTATVATNYKDWIVWGDVLYRNINPEGIKIGDQYVVGSNIEQFNMEDIIGHLQDLNTKDKSNLVYAINEAINTFNTIVGDIDNLNTTDKSNLVSAINEAINTFNTIVGDIDNLITTDNTDIVNAINSSVISTREIIINVKDFGAVGDGVHDDLTAINDAINYLKPNGGTIYFPGGTYAISAPIHIGDGTARTTLGTNNSNDSTYNSIKFKGVGCKRVGSPKTTEITPLSAMDAVIYVDGKISNIEISGITLWANGLAKYGLYMCATSFSKFTDIYIYNPTVAGLVVMGGSLPTGNYNTFNTFEHIFVVLNTNNTIGLLMDGVLIRDGKPVNNDSWISNFIDCRFDTLAGTTGCRCGVFKFVDNITFIRCHFVGDAGDVVGVEFNALSSAPNNPFPSGLSFIDCSIKNYSVVEDSVNDLIIGKQYLIGAGVNDLEQLPRNEKIFGFDANGRLIGGFTCTRINTYDELVDAIVTVPNGHAINIVLSETFTKTYIGHDGYYAGMAQRISDNIVQINVIGNEGSLFVIFDLSTSNRISWGKVGSKPNLTTLSELSAISDKLADGEFLQFSVLPAFISTYFGDTVKETSAGILQKTNSTLANAYIFCYDDQYYIEFNPKTNTVINSGKLSNIPYKRFTSLSDLTDACKGLTQGNMIMFECNSTVTNALAGVSTESQGSIIYVDGAAQISFSNNIGLYYARLLVSDGTIVQSGHIDFTQNT